MPPKTVICSICGYKVNKRQTLLIGEGLRACHFHEEAKRKSEELRNVEKKQKELKKKELKKKELKKTNRFLTTESLEKHKDFVQNYCWVCCKKGINIKELYYKMLVGMEKIKLKGEQIDFLNMPFQLKKEMGLENVPTLVTIEVKNKDISKFLHRMVSEFYSFTQTAQICIECLKKLDLFDEWQKSIPQPSLNQMLYLGKTYQTSDLAKNVLKDAVDGLKTD